MGLTTIQTTEEQSRFLDDMEKGSKKAALQILIEEYDGSTGRGLTEDEVRDIVRSEVVPEALE